MNPAAAGTPPGARRHRVLLVREWEQQTTGCGCGGMESEHDRAAGAGSADCRADMEAMGAIYRALRKELPRIDVQIVDPRNLTFLIPGMVADARRGGASWGEALRELPRGCGQGAIVVDGHVVSSGLIPSADDAVDLVLRQLAASTS